MEKYTYEVIEDLNIILRSDGASIPKDPANSDYQRYLNPEVEHLTEIPTPLAE
jgi:hypothetical protein